jgi:glycosyltransferase involved in cell wall biosynthesis
MTIDNKQAIHWDIAISCFEPLDLVTGGIGTYTRMLLNILTDDPTLKTKNIALFCRRATASLKAKAKGNFTIFEIPDDWQIYGKNVERLGNEHDWYSWNLAHYLLGLAQKGHSFAHFEFSDYAVEGYFPIKMRRSGLLKIDTVSVRLHSPELMLFRDNLLPGRSYDGDRLTRMSRELFCYQHSDKILYGAPAMLDRVATECRRFGVTIEHKAVHVEHPYPVHANEQIEDSRFRRAAIHLGYIGRLETRKGILRFLRTIADNDALRTLVQELDIIFELFGADCLDQNNASIRTQILSLHQVPELRGRIIAHGYMSQDDLKEKTKNLDGFIFPSLFENYPNALLEVLDTKAPILISSSGGMPYISRDLPGMYHFSYNSNLTKDIEEFLCSIRPVPDRQKLYFSMAENVNKSIALAYGALSEIRKDLQASSDNSTPIGVDFVIPFYNDSLHVAECLASVKAAMAEEDKLYIVDDVSRMEEFHALGKTISKLFGDDPRVEIHRMTINSGPSAVRNFGSRLGDNTLIQFIDADDNLNTTGFRTTKYYITYNKDVDFVYGIQDNFGSRNHIWIPRDASAMTCLDENYTHSAILIRRTTFEESGGFDDELRLHFEDWQFNCKMALSGYRGEVVPFVTQHYRVRDGSRTYRNLEREDFSREQVIDRTCMNRGPQENMLRGELLELIGKYSSLINGRWKGGGHHDGIEEPIITHLSLANLSSLQGEEFVRAAYGVILGRRADEDGLKFYINKLHDGVKTRNIIADMMTSSEVKRTKRILPKEYYRELRWARWARHPLIKKVIAR